MKRLSDAGSQTLRRRQERQGVIGGMVALNMYTENVFYISCLPNFILVVYPMSAYGRSKVT